MMANIQITRADERTNRLRKYKIYIDNEKAGEISNGETKDFMVAPGTHTIIAKLDWSSSSELTVETNADKATHLKVKSGQYMKLLPFFIIPLIIIRFALPPGNRDELTLILAIPILLAFIYPFTLGRKKYLTLEVF